MQHPKVLAFASASAFAAGWALYLVHLHNQAVAHLLTPGALCADGGCEGVLGSTYATVLGVAVSAPAVPMFAVLAVLGLLVWAGRVAPERVAGLAVLCGLGGVAFGGWLLWHMLVTIASVCNYCLIMDAANLAVLALGAALHPGGPIAALRAVPDALAGLVQPGPELSLVPAVVVGTIVIAVAMPEPIEAPPAPVAVEAPSVAPSAAAVVPTGGTAEKTGETRRVVLSEKVHDIPIGADVPVRGKADAPVTIAVFEDFQCPFCSKLTGNLEAILHERPDDVRVAWFHFPMHSSCSAAPLKKDLHEHACNAAAASVCAQKQGRFWEMHDVLFHNSAHLRPKDLVGYARQLRLDEAAFRACMEDPSTMAKVRADTAVGAANDVGGTPTFFVNGRPLTGAQPVEAIRAAVDAVLASPEGRVLLDVEVEGEVTGEVTGPAEVQLRGPYGAFTIDAFEASIEGGAAVSRPGVEPARGVTWFEADLACKNAGKRLCTEEEWLAACTGQLPVDEDRDGIYSDDKILGRLHPYGDWPQDTWCASARKKDDPRPLVTGTHPRCVTPEGVYDLEGLTKEWIGLVPAKAGLKGGSYYSIGSARCGYLRDDVAVDTSDPSNGFRCCSGPTPGDAAVGAFPGGQVGDRLQAWTLPDLAGGTFGTDQLKGKAVIMSFWASWCGPCRNELPALAEMYEKYKGDGLVIVGVNVDDDPNKARAFLEQVPLPFPVALDTGGRLQSKFDAQSLPTAFWVTKDGLVRQRTVGYDPEEKHKLEANVRALLGL